jgi:hypothetical protein
MKGSMDDCVVGLVETSFAQGGTTRIRTGERVESGEKPVSAPKARNVIAWGKAPGGSERILEALKARNTVTRNQQ